MDASEAWVRAWIKIACLECVSGLAKIHVDSDKGREVIIMIIITVTKLFIAHKLNSTQISI